MKYIEYHIWKEKSGTDDTLSEQCQEKLDWTYMERQLPNCDHDGNKL